MKYLILLALLISSTNLPAIMCKTKGCSRTAGATGYCTIHRDEAKKNKQKLKLKSFVGFNFLSKGGNDEIKTCQLKKPFRGFTTAKLYYSSLGRLYQITLEDAVAGRTGEEIKAELATISTILEKKYKFTFPEELKCDGGFCQTGGGYSIATRSHAPIRIVSLKKTSWYRQMKWEDFQLDLHGELPKNGSSTNTVSKLKVSFTMNKIRQMDTEKSKQDAAKKALRDTKGIDAL